MHYCGNTKMSRLRSQSDKRVFVQHGRLYYKTGDETRETNILDASGHTDEKNINNKSGNHVAVCLDSVIT